MTPSTAATTRVRTVRVVGGVSLRRPRPATLARLPLYGLGLTMLVPFYWMVIGTFKSVGELLRQPPTPVPEHPSLSNFSGHGRVKGLFQQFTNVRFGFWHFFLNSIVVTVAVTAGSLLLASLAAYALTKTRLPWRRALFIVIIGPAALQIFRAIQNGSLF